MDIKENITSNLVNDLSNKFDSLLIEGLKRKGFIFSSKEDILSFVKENCRCEDFKEREERVYYVNDNPFLLHNYKIDIPVIEQINDNITIRANYGSYSFL